MSMHAIWPMPWSIQKVEAPPAELIHHCGWCAWRLVEQARRAARRPPCSERWRTSAMPTKISSSHCPQASYRSATAAGTAVDADGGSSSHRRTTVASATRWTAPTPQKEHVKTCVCNGYCVTVISKTKPETRFLP